MKKSAHIARLLVCLLSMSLITGTSHTFSGLQAADLLKTLWRTTYGEVERDAATSSWQSTCRN